VVGGVGRAFVADLVRDRGGLGSAYGIYHAVLGAAALPASLAAGILWQSRGPSTPFYFGAGLALAATLVLLTVKPRTPVLSSPQ
jgi:hypothetical protein